MRDGAGGETEYAEAIRLFTASSKGGNSYAKISLGELYESGRGTPRNATRARELYTEAAREGEPAARQKLAQMGKAQRLAGSRPSKVASVALDRKR